MAEDDPDSRDLVEHLLKHAGYQVLSAEDGEGVFDILEHQTPSLFLLDCNMPKLGGLEVCQRLKANPRLSDIPVIFLTVLSAPEDKVRGFEVGGADYVTKPIEKLELLARIHSHLELAINRHMLQRKASLLQTVTEEQCGRLDEVRAGQETMLTQPSAFPELKVAVRFNPAHEAGGDFYEIARFADDEFGFFVADVSGHDLSVPFITGALKALAVTFINESLTPQETMTMFNASAIKLLQEDRYITAGYARFSRSRMEVELASAGHPPALLQKMSGDAEYVPLVGDVLGMFELVRFESRRFEVQPGERLFLYSDGLIEGYPDSTGRRGRALWGMGQFRENLKETRSMAISEAVDHIVDQLLDQWSGGADDDIVVLGIEF